MDINAILDRFIQQDIIAIATSKDKKEINKHIAAYNRVVQIKKAVSSFTCYGDSETRSVGESESWYK